VNVDRWGGVVGLVVLRLTDPHATAETYTFAIWFFVTGWVSAVFLCAWSRSQ
jgi:hypothetical protein